MEQLLAATHCAVQTKAVRPAEFERVIVDSTLQSTAIASPVDSQLLEIARHKVRCGQVLRRQPEADPCQGGQNAAPPGRRRSSWQAVQAATQDGQSPAHEAASDNAVSDLPMWLERAESTRTQPRDTENKLNALHATSGSAGGHWPGAAASCPPWPSAASDPSGRLNSGAASAPTAAGCAARQARRSGCCRR